jgi:prepilin-type N-terminal cleavage/methylation domain-containing protein
MGVRAKAFTLVEVLIVITLVAILASIAVPKFSNSAQRGKEASLRQSLRIIRLAGDRCEADTGVTVDIPNLASAAPPANGWVRGKMGTTWAKVAIDPATWHGPYLSEVPLNPITGNSVYITGGSTSASWTHWSNQTFNTHYYYFPSNERGSDGTQYKTW